MRRPPRLRFTTRSPLRTHSCPRRARALHHVQVSALTAGGYLACCVHLWLPAREGDAVELSRLLELQPWTVDEPGRDGQGYTNALQVAAASGHAACVALLLDAGAIFRDACWKPGSTPTPYVCSTMLANAGYSPPAEGEAAGSSPPSRVPREAYVEILSMLLDRADFCEGQVHTARDPMEPKRALTRLHAPSRALTRPHAPSRAPARLAASPIGSTRLLAIAILCLGLCLAGRPRPPHGDQRDDGHLGATRGRGAHWGTGRGRRRRGSGGQRGGSASRDGGGAGGAGAGVSRGQLKRGLLRSLPHASCVRSVAACVRRRVRRC